MTSKFVLSSKSQSKLIGLHPDLIKVVQTAITIASCDFTVLCGMRSVEEQKTLVALGRSQTMRSRHLTGHAVDLGAWVDGSVNWSTHYYELINGAMLEAAHGLNIPLEWGGMWKTIKDLDHWQLPWNVYP